MIKLLAVGPLPPPVGGFSVMTEAVLRHFENTFVVLPFNRSQPPISNAHLRRLWSIPYASLACVKFSFSAKENRKDGIVYVALSGGWGQVVDGVFILIARSMGIPIVLHHHSFSYLNEQRWITKICLQCAGQKSQHITLCVRMAKLLIERYDRYPINVHSISNSAFLWPKNINNFLIEPTYPDALNEQPLRIGIIGNLNVEKGILRFLDAVVKLHDAGLAVQSEIAGPIDSVVEDLVKDRTRAIAKLRLWGPVYGEQKEEFWRSIDVLLFPSSYANEAEPVTILEAFIHNVAVIGTARGCCIDMLDPDEFDRKLIDEHDYATETARHIVIHNIALKSFTKRRTRDWLSKHIPRNVDAREVLVARLRQMVREA